MSGTPRVPRQENNWEPLYLNLHEHGNDLFFMFLTKLSVIVLRRILEEHFQLSIQICFRKSKMPRIQMVKVVFFNLGPANSFLGSLKMLKIVLYGTFRFHQVIRNFQEVPRIEKG